MLNALVVQQGGKALCQPFSATLGMTCVYGPNGVGKTTLLDTLCGWIKPHAGTFSLSGKIAYLGNQTQLVDTMTVGEMIHWVGGRGYSPLEAWELSPETPIGHLSKGMQQRLRVCLMEYAQADVWLLDEPLTYLDTSWSNRVLDCLEKSKAVVLFTAHTPVGEHALEMCHA